MVDLASQLIYGDKALYRLNLQFVNKKRKAMKTSATFSFS